MRHYYSLYEDPAEYLIHPLRRLLPYQPYLTVALERSLHTGSLKVFKAAGTLSTKLTKVWSTEQKLLVVPIVINVCPAMVRVPWISTLSAMVILFEASLPDAINLKFCVTQHR